MPLNETPEPIPPSHDAIPPPAPPPTPASPSLVTQEEPPDLGKWFQRYIYGKFGLRGLIFVAVLALLWSSWNWSTVKDLPGVSSIVTWFSQTPLPKADPQRFAVALAHLEHDKDQQYEHLIREALKDFEGVQLLQFDRTISLGGTKPEESEKKGHAQARQYLEDAGAHVLIWGLVLSQNDKSALRLYWTTLQESKRAKESFQAENFKLPELFWNDLQAVLRLVVASQSSKFLAQEGRFIAGQLASFIPRVRSLLNQNSRQRRWVTIQLILANALLTFGEQSGTHEPLEEAVTTFRAALTEQTRERVPLDWAATQNNLGNALTTLGEQSGTHEPLEEAVTAFRAALTEQTRERVPLDWARTQNNLGNALMRLGEREMDTARLKEAVTAFQAALTEQTRERVPLDWAATQNNLGLTLMRLGEREMDTARLKEAITAHQAALTAQIRERVPLDWAATQNNLGNALMRLGEQTRTHEPLEEAATAYQAALTEWTRERVPLDWAMAQSNLGTALMLLGEREEGTAWLKEAISAFRAALTERTRERVPLDWAMTQNNLGNALMLLGERKKDAPLICEALGKQLMAWEIFVLDSPYHAKTVASNVGRVITAMKNTFDFSIYDACMAQYSETLKRIGLPTLPQSG